MTRTSIHRHSDDIIKRAMHTIKNDHLTWSTDGSLMSVYIPWQAEPLFTCEVSEVATRLPEYADVIVTHVLAALTHEERWIRCRAHNMQKHTHTTVDSNVTN